MAETAVAEIVAPGVVRLTRSIAADHERVWRLLTEPGEIAKWMTTAEIDLRKGGDVRFMFGDDIVTGVIRELAPQRVIEYTWQEAKGDPGVVRYELGPSDSGGTPMTLTHSQLGDKRQEVGFAAGWHAHLDCLEGVVDGRHVEWIERWTVLKPVYEERFGAKY